MSLHVYCMYSDLMYCYLFVIQISVLYVSPYTLHTSYNLRPDVDKSTIRHSANPDLGQCNLSGLKGYVALTVIIRVIASGRFWGGLGMKDSHASGLSQNATLCICSLN